MKHTEKRRPAGLLAIALSRRVTIKGLALIGFVLGVSDSAQAYLKICNQTASEISVAIAYGAQDAPGTTTNQHIGGVTAKGWWNIASKKCAQVASFDAASHWLYYRSKTKDGNSGGRSWLCISEQRFVLGQQFRKADFKCPGDQYLAGFTPFEATAANFIFNLK